MTDSRTQVRAGQRFSFGGNWVSFAELVDETRIRAAIESLAHALGVADLSGRTFLDVGCGSGLFSLAASRMGARVRSFDFDPDSVAATAGLRRDFAPDADWTVEPGSILDEEFTAGLGRFGIVYSWGVLHHTGDLWRALATTAGLVGPGGLLFVSVYNHQGRQSRMWWHVKRRYNRSGPVGRRLLVAASAVYLRRWSAVRALLRLRRAGRLAAAPAPRMRGMSRKHDLIDWVGGFPFEVAKPEEVFAFMRERGFALRFMTTCGGDLGCNEFVFERTAGA